MSGYHINQTPARLAMGAASLGLGVISYGLYKVGVNLDILNAGAISHNPFVIVPPAATGLLSTAMAIGAVSPHNDGAHPEQPPQP